MGKREAAMAALFSVLGGAYAFAAKSRRLRDPEDVPGEKRPAFFLVEHEDDYHASAVNLPVITEMTVYAMIYTDTPLDNDIPATQVNEILDAFDTALAGKGWIDDGRQTLGGLVYACMIEGTVIRSSGDTTGKAVTALPIKLTLTGVGV